MCVSAARQHNTNRARRDGRAPATWKQPSKLPIPPLSLGHEAQRAGTAPTDAGALLGMAPPARVNHHWQHWRAQARALPMFRCSLRVVSRKRRPPKSAAGTPQGGARRTGKPSNFPRPHRAHGRTAALHPSARRHQGKPTAEAAAHEGGWQKTQELKGTQAAAQTPAKGTKRTGQAARYRHAAHRPARARGANCEK